jgi:hypothetical protein
MVIDWSDDECFFCFYLNLNFFFVLLLLGFLSDLLGVNAEVYYVAVIFQPKWSENE